MQTFEMDQVTDSIFRGRMSHEKYQHFVGIFQNFLKNANQACILNPNPYRKPYLYTHLKQLKTGRDRS